MKSWIVIVGVFIKGSRGVDFRARFFAALAELGVLRRIAIWEETACE